MFSCVGAVLLLCRILLLCACIICLKFFVQLYEIFNVFLLKMVCSGFDLGKHWEASPRNCAPMFVLTPKLKGGLYQMTFLWFLGLSFLFFVLFGFMARKRVCKNGRCRQELSDSHG